MPDPFEIICEDTSKIPRAEWLKLRKQGLGSSDVAPALEQSPWRSFYALYCEKRGIIAEQEQSENFAWALELERPILDWCESHRWCGPMRRHLMMRSVQYPFLLANPDGLTDDVVVEAKTAHSMDEKRWIEGVPDHYNIQAHALMIVTGRRECLMPVQFGTNPPSEFFIRWDPQMAKAIIEGAARAWEQIQTGVEPDPDDSESTMQALRERYMASVEGSMRELPEGALELIGLRNTAHAIIKTHEGTIAGVKNQLMAWMENAESGTIHGEVAVTWKPNAKGTRTFLFKEMVG